MADPWLPVPCYNAAAAALAFSPETILSKLTRAGIFDWYRDENHTLPIALEDLSTLDELKAVTWQVYHLAHCIYSWQATIRTFNHMLRGEKDVYVHSKLLEEPHVRHYAMVLAGNGGEEGIIRGTQVEVRFSLGECARLDSDGKAIRMTSGPPWRRVISDAMIRQTISARLHTKPDPHIKICPLPHQQANNLLVLRLRSNMDRAEASIINNIRVSMLE